MHRSAAIVAAEVFKTDTINFPVKFFNFLSALIVSVVLSTQSRAHISRRVRTSDYIAYDSDKFDLSDLRIALKTSLYLNVRLSANAIHGIILEQHIYMCVYISCLVSSYIHYT